MICTDKLSEDIKRSSCPQDTLRGFTGDIILRDWRGYNRFNPNDNYKDYVEIEAERYLIKPSYDTEVRDDNISLFTHALSFAIKNNSDEAAELLAGYTNIPLIISLRKQDGSYLTLFKDTGAKLNISSEYFDASNGMVMVTCQHFHKEVKESLSPVRESLSDVFIWDIAFTVFDESNQPVQNATISISGNTYTTDNNGKATVRLTNGNYSYTVDATGYEQYSDSVIVDGADEKLTINMSKIQTHQLTIHVYDASTNNSISGASVIMDDVGTQITNENGQAFFYLLPGTYVFDVIAEGYKLRNDFYTTIPDHTTWNIPMVLSS
jgi:hypothetical protein